MINTRELVAALYGTWLLLKFDPRGFEYFEKTPGGFARSFFAAAIVAPLQLAHAILIFPQAKAKLAFAPFVVVQALAFVLGWVSFPFLMLYIGDLLNRRERYFWQMVPYNWFQLVISLPLSLLLLMLDLQMLSVQAVSFLNLVAVVAFFVYATFIGRVGLQIGVLTALGVVFLDYVVSTLIRELINRI